MRTRGQHRTGAAAMAGLALLALGAGAPAHAVDQPAPGKRPVARDVTPPARPTLGEAEIRPGGAIDLAVQAEADTALVVREGAEAVASAAAVGDPQTLSWTTGTGAHTFLVVATD